MATFRHGKGQYFQLDNSSGTLVDISNVLNNVSFPKSIDTGEVTAFGANSKSYIVGLQDATLSIEGSYDATVDTQITALIDALSAGTKSGTVPTETASWVYGPEGSATGRIKYSGEAILSSYEVSAPVGDVVTFKAQLQASGAVTRGTF